MELAIRGNCVCCFAVDAIFVGFEEVKESGGESFKVVIWGVAMQATRRDNFYGKEWFSLCNTAALKFIVSLTGYCRFD